MKHYKAALFDMDGTLLESMHFWRNVVADWMQRQGNGELPLGEKEKLEAMSVGGGLRYVQETYAGTPWGAVSWPGLFAVMAEHYRRDVRLKPGARELLTVLRDKKIPMGIATGTPHHLADIALETAGLSEYFQFVLSPDEFPEGKKEPRIFEESLRRLGGASPRETLFFEDALYSVQTAKAMGFYVIAVKEPYSIKDTEKIAALSDLYWQELNEESAVRFLNDLQQ